MTIAVRCGSCSRNQRVPDDKGGTAITCENCGVSINVPEVRTARFKNPDDETFGNQTWGEKQGLHVGLMIVGFGIAGVVLLAGLALVFIPRDANFWQAPQHRNAKLKIAPPAAHNPNLPQPHSPADVERAIHIPPAPADPLVPVVPAAAQPQIAPQIVETEPIDDHWQAIANPPAVPFEWPENLALSIPIPGRVGDICFPTFPSPFVAIGFEPINSTGVQMWNLVTGMRVGEIRGRLTQHRTRAVSHDGRFLAVHAIHGTLQNLVELWSFETGEKVSDIDCDDNAFRLIGIDFAGPGQFVSYTYGFYENKLRHHLKFWEIETGKLLRAVDLDLRDVNPLIHAFSPGYRYFATMGQSGTVYLYDLQSGSLTGKMSLGSGSTYKSSARTNAVIFSQDGSELVALLEGPAETRIVTINMQTGQPEPNLTCTIQARLLPDHSYMSRYRGPRLECLPHNAGFLLGGSIWIDARTKHAVWYLQHDGSYFNQAPRRAIPNGLIVAHGLNAARKLTVVEIPWNKIRLSTDAMQADAPAYVRPGSAVSLDLILNFRQLADFDKVRIELTDIITKRLAANGVAVQEGQSSVLHIRYDEADSDPSQASISLAWHVENDSRKVWEKIRPINLPMQKPGKAADLAQSKTTLHAAKEILQVEPIFFFIPQDVSLLPLPGSTNLNDKR